MNTMVTAAAVSVKDVSSVNLNKESGTTEDVLTCSICMDTPEDRGVLDCVSYCMI